MIAQYGKRVLSFILAMIMVFSAVPAQAFAVEIDGDPDQGIVVASEPVEVPSEPTPSEPTPSEPTPSEPTPSEPTPSEPTPSEPTPSEPTPSEPTPSEPTPSEPASSEPAPSEPTPSEPTPSEPAESQALIALRAEIADYIETYGLTPDMPDSVLANVYFALNGEQAQAAWTGVEKFLDQGMELSFEEQELLLEEQNSKLVKRFYEVMQSIRNPVILADKTFQPVQGVSVQVTGTTSSVTENNGNITVTMKGTTSCGVNGYNTANVIITNELGKKAIITFDWKNTNCVDTDGVLTGNPFSVTLEANGQLQIELQSPNGSSNSGTFELSSFTCEEVQGSIDITFEYDNARGSVTHNGEVVENGAVVPVASSGATLQATATGSNQFVAWVDEDNKVVSRDATFNITPETPMVLKVVFAGTDPVFLVDNTYVVQGLNEAMAKGSKVVLMNNATLPAGDYTIPSGVTLLIPYDAANTLCTTKPTTSEAAYSAPTVYRKLTMAEGANIVINGALSLSATQRSGSGQSSPIGSCSFIQMNSGSTITVNNGGKLYAWGYIQGSGAVTVESGATVYECFQVMDWRGGDNTSSMIDNSKRVFPMSQYYIQNIEVPMTLKAGAIEKGYMSVQITLVGIQGSDVPFIGSDGMFNITSGHIVKDYDENTGRLIIDVYGNLSVKSLSLTMKLGLIGSKTINSSKYTLPINGNMTITMHSGAVTMTQDIALQPGARLIVGKDATCTLGSGNRIYVYDYDQWIHDSGDTYDEGKSFCGNADAAYVNLQYPASAKTVQGRTEDAYVEVNGTVDASAGFVYTTDSGANVRGTGTIIMKPGTETATYQVKSLGSDSKTITYYDIPITSAKLTNTDGTYTETANATGKVIYKSINGVWTCEHTYADGTYTENVTTPATCEGTGVKTITCHCGGHSKTVDIPALGHSYESVVTAPTCTTAGYTTHTCKNDASHTYTDSETSALGHDEVSHEAKAPTCGEIGWDAYVTCSRCDYTTYVEKAALGHDEVAHEAKAPTCTEIGWDAYVTCSRCDYTTYAEKAALGHDEVAHEAKDPTCTEIGWNAYVTCSRCDYTTYAEKASLGHDEIAHEAKDPTCTEIGWDAYVTCTRCDYTTYAEKAALGHDEVAHEAKDPTCTEIGWDAYVTCTRCDYTTYAEKAALDHDKVSHEAKAPTCTEVGWDAYETCTRCDYTTYEEKGVVDHTWEWITDKAATVLETGIKHEECSVCHEKRNENTIIDILKCEHTGTLEITPAKAATCTEEGNSRYSYCSACQNYYSDDAGQHEIEERSWVIPALDHDEVSHEAKAPTCTEIGWDAYVTCSRCDYTTYAEKASLGHDEVAHEAQAPTCTEIGWDAYVSCSRCDYTTYVEKASLGHDEIEHAAQAPTCTEIGWDAYVTCSRCDYSTYAEQASLGHDEIEHAAQAPTCTEIGWDAYVTCSRCDYSTYAEQASLGHDEVAHEAQAPTCTEIGWEAYVTCSRCDYSTYVESPAKGHGVLEEVEAVAATCQAEGVVAHWHCPDCGLNFADEAATQKLDSVVTPIEPDNHTWADDGEETKATCQAEGKVVYECVNDGCEETKEEILPIDPEGHVWDEGEIYKNHSCNSASYMKYTCTLCDEENLVLVREQHFRIPIAEEIPATCTEDGMTSGWKCEKCDEFWIPQEVIPALGHDWNGNLPCQSETSACTRCDLHFDTKQEHLVVVDPAVPSTCTETGLTEGSHCGYCGEVLVAQTEIPVAEHTWVVADMEVPATCGINGHKEGARYCLICNYDEDPIPALEHEWMHRDAKKATYSAIGWSAHDYCLLCKTVKTLEQYESDPCEFCGENPEGYVEIPKVEIQRNETLEEFLSNIGYLEMIAEKYAMEHPGADPLGLVLNYMRTGVENYTSGSWAIMAGPEDKEFFNYVQEMEDAVNSDPSIAVWVNVSGLKKIKSYKSPSEERDPYNNSWVDCMSGHFFGTMDMTYHNKGSQNHADVGGWVGDLTDLLSTTDQFGVDPALTLEEKVAYIREHYLFSGDLAGAAGSFGSPDLYADLDGYYFMNELITKGYKTGDLEKLMREYFQPGLTLKSRVSYLLTNRLDGLSTRKDLRDAVYNTYTSNKLIATLEGTRNFVATGNELTELRKAVCYAFADEMCRIAGDYVEDLTNPRFTVFDSETKILAPGISQQINYATNADGKQIVYYVATADVNREDVGLWVNYYSREPGTPEKPIWKNNSVPSSAQNAQDRYGDPESPDYIENFNVIASTNAGGYDMSDVATPGGLMVMNGVEWYPNTGSAGFFAILDDGTAYMGDPGEYETMKDQIQEAIGGFGEFVVKDGVVTGSATYSDAPRTSVGITSTGRVVIMCIDGRQAPFSSGASLQDVGYIMKEAGCVVAINLDGGGSTTFVARQPGSDELTVMNRPSDGYPRNVSSNLLLYSTAPSSTKFDHAVIESEYDYATVNTPVQMTAAGVSPSGNAVDIPEGATWAVSDENWGSITEDGVFTAKRLGAVTVYLILDGKEVGSKLMTITTPDQLYFEKTKVDAIYGSSVVLPLRARVGGKAIAINPNDVTITLSAPTAGTMDGFTFQAAESAVKTLSITASIGENISASINVMLYQQGENSFDFDKATGGDRTFAWDRQVSNAKVEDGNIYNVIDPAKDMVTSYTFALDMTAIPIPARLEELTYMLPGGTMDGANAWSFLLSLAQRISDLTWVKATVDFDDRFVVDYSNMKVLNDYFELTGTEFDETTNTLTVTLNWIKQSQVIDEATANPLCLINGLKLTPKDGVWEDTTKINAVTSGTIGYEIYMRASGLYSFAQKPENQAVFGLYPYRNPADTADAGGYFRDTYAEVTDEYTLVNVLKEGWVNEEGGFAYYIDGERLTGVQEVEGLYYDFGEDGINVGQMPYTGLFQIEGSNYYTKNGEIVKGWNTIGEEYYLFDWQTGEGEHGTYQTTIEGVEVTYEFDNGRLVKGHWHETEKGIQYFYGPYLYKQGLKMIDGEQYIFENYYVCTGIRPVKMAHATTAVWYEFTDKGVLLGYAEDGLHWYEGNLYYVVDAGSKHYGFYLIDGNYYYFQSNGQAVVGKNSWTSKTNDLLPEGTYRFDAEGKAIMTTEVVNENGTLYYYANGKRTASAGLVLIDGDYYYIGGGAIAMSNVTTWVEKTNDLKPKGSYTFDADGKMIIYNGVVDGYYYVDGVKTSAGLVKFEGDYYYAGGGGKLTTGKPIWVSNTNGYVEVGTYRFDADGKMIMTTELVDENGTLYYYLNGKRTANVGLIKVGEDYYYISSGAMPVMDKTIWVEKGNGLMPQGIYTFAADGKMVIYNGVVDGYYYVDGIKTAAGLVLVDGSYYYAGGGGKLIVSKPAWVSNTNGYVEVGTYRFDAEGKMIMTTELVDEDGILYYYLNGKRTANVGLIKVGEDYYYVSSGAKAVQGRSVWVDKPNGYVEVGTYRFGADGKMIMTTDVVNEDGTYYYYSNGKRTASAGLVLLNGYYYYIDGAAKAVCNVTQWVEKTNGLKPKGNYTFDAEARMVIHNGIVDGYYYVDGVKTAAGLVKIDGDYYYAAGYGKIIVSKPAWVSNTNGYVDVGTYRFDAEGKMILTTELVDENGTLYYYLNGKRTANAGLLLIDGDYYYIGSGAIAVTNDSVWVEKTNGLMAKGTYTFDAEGKMIQ